MGRALFDAFAESREVFEAADRALERPISELCFSGSAEDLALTENTQPAILTVSVAALRALQTRGLNIVATAGHSLGEYSAHVAAGTIEFDEAVCTVRQRGRFMQDAVPVGHGAMAAILGLERERVDAICAATAGAEVVAAANFNSPGQIVIAGHASAVQRAIEAARSQGAKRAVLLPVSAPFHCSLMAPAADRLAPVLEAMRFSKPGCPVFTNADGRPVAEAVPAREALLRQVASPVLWQELVEAMLGEGIDTFVEVGPGKVLTGLMRRIRKDATVLSVSDPEGVARVARELGAAA